MRLALVSRYIGHEQALVHVNLRRGKPDAGCGIHGLEHIVDQRPERVINDLNRCGPRPEPRIREL